MKHIKASFLSLREDKRIIFLMAISESVFTINTVLFFYLQIYWTDQGHVESYITIIFAITSILTGLVAYRASAIEKLLGKKRTIIFILVFSLFLVWAIALFDYSPLFFIILGSCEGLLIAAFGSYINDLLNSKERATILSMQSMLFSLMMIMVFPLVGFISTHWSMQVSFIYLGVLSTINTFVCLKWMVPILTQIDK